MSAERHLEIAWAAGLFDGEGCFSVGRGRYGLTYARASLTSTDRDIAERFQEAMGCGTIIVHKPGPPRKPQYRWRTNSRADFNRVAALLRPYLCSRRAERLAEVEAETSPTRRKRRPVTTCKRGHPLVGDNRKPNGRTKDGGQRITCRTCAQARERGELTTADCTLEKIG